MAKELRIKEVVTTGDKSDYGYGMTIFNDLLNTAYNDDGQMMVRAYSGNTKYKRYQENGHKYISNGSKAPALCTYEGNLYLANRESSNNGDSEPIEFSKYESPTNWDRDNFSSNQMNGVEPETDKGPAMVSFNNQMHMVAKRNARHVMQHSWFDGHRWHWYEGNNRHSIPFTGGSEKNYDIYEDEKTGVKYLPTEQSPALAVVEDKLLCAFKNCYSREGNKPIVTVEFNGKEWKHNHIVKHDGDIIKSELGVGLAYYKGNVWIVYVDPKTSHLKYLYYSNDHKKWRGNKVLDRSECANATVTSKCTPTLLPVMVNGQERLALSFADKNENIQLYYMDVIF